MPTRPRLRTPHRGSILATMLVALALATAAALAVPVAGHAMRVARERETERALSAAREALLAYAAGRPVDAIIGPGYLPCPDLDNDGWAESTCGSQNGETGQAQRLGRLPWKTLGIPDLRDGHGERLWYAVSSKHKGLLNCTVSTACVDMSPDAALGTITVRDASGRVVRDGRSNDLYRASEAGAAAVVLAPGPAIERAEGASGARRMQVRDCPPGACDAAGRCTTTPATAAAACDPANFLDKAAGPALGDEDNAGFRDRNDDAGRPLNADGFIRGPVRLADGTLVVNDRLAEIGYDDLAPRVMRRVAAEVASCLRSLPGPLPPPAPLCRQSGADPALAWEAQEGTLFGRIPAIAFAGCAIAHDAPAPNWWRAWRRHVFYAIAAAERTGGTCADPGKCLQVVAHDGALLATARRAAILVAGAPLAAAGQSHAGADESVAAAWLEGPHPALERRNANPAAPECAPAAIAPCGPGESCNAVMLAPRGAAFNDVVATLP